MIVNENTSLYQLKEIVAALTGEGGVSDLQRSAFDELLVTEPTPQVQLQFPYNINSSLVDISSSGDGAVTQVDNKAHLETGAASNSVAVLKSKRSLKYHSGQGAMVRFTALFTEGVADSLQIIGIGDENDGFFVGFNGTQFGVLKRHEASDVWVYRTDWNRDIADGSGKLPNIDLTKGNVFQIKYQWLGFGSVKFYLENPTDGKLILIHTIEFANSSTLTSIHNPTIPLYARTENFSNATNIYLETPSMAAFIEGRIAEEASALFKSKGNAKIGITTELNILTIRNRGIYHSLVNRVRIRPMLMTLTNEGTKDVEFKLVKDTTLGGTPSYSFIDEADSVVEYDTAGTTLTGGEELLTLAVAKNSSLVFPIPFKFYLSPDETLTISANSSLATDVNVSIVWADLF